MNQGEGSGREVRKQGKGDGGRIRRGGNDMSIGGKRREGEGKRGEKEVGGGRVEVMGQRSRHICPASHFGRIVSVLRLGVVNCEGFLPKIKNTVKRGANGRVMRESRPYQRGRIILLSGREE